MGIRTPYGVLALKGYGYGVATGGTSSSITVSSQAYTLLTFTADGTLTVGKAGLFDVLMFGGGAGGQQYASGSGGGGGGGGIVNTTIYLPATTYAITVGAGGISGTLTSATGASFGRASIIGTIPNAYVTAVGGFGQVSQVDGSGEGVIGCGNGSTFTAGNNGISNAQGFKGGNAAGAATAGGGGGGTTAVGGNGSSTTGGAGGAGYDVSAFISGSALYKGGGGGGGGSVTGGAGGSSVGGAGGAVSGVGSAAAANTAGGGGGGAGTSVGGAGGSGIVYVRFKV
jgi:hypothetical protein